ncbi:MAG: (Fe-S)-binding protein, partial [Bacteroidales bacterium]
MDPTYFSPFVLPFCIGVIVLLIICTIKYTRWFKQFDRLQRVIIRKNIFSWRFVAAIGEAFTECLLHRKVNHKNILLGYMHRSIAFGWFLLIVIGAIESSLAVPSGKPLWLGIFYRYFVPGTHLFKGERFLTNLMDLILLYVLSGIFLAVCKRIYSGFVGIKRPTKHVIFDKFALFSLWCIFPLRLLSESLTATLVNNGGFLTQSIGDLFSHSFANNFELTSWTLYSFALGTFFVALPFSRYMHIFTEPFLIYFRKIGVYENEKSSGYTKFELSACSRCGICIDSCPLSSELGINNVQSVYFLRDIRYKKLKQEIADNCLMCNRCVNDCPVGLELTTIRKQKRYKEELDTHDNYAYLNNIQSFNSIGRVIYFAGCMSHLTPGITSAMKNIFEKVGQKYWFMDEERSICCGRPLLQQGFIQQATELRRKNTALIKQSGAQLLITSCPICYQSFKKEYNLPIKVMHHTEYLNLLIKENKLPLTKDDLKIVYHDPCELGRGCGIYKEPRNVLKAVSKLVKSKYEKSSSLCCGYNLGDTVLELDQQMK